MPGVFDYTQENVDKAYKMIDAMKANYGLTELALPIKETIKVL